MTFGLRAKDGTTQTKKHRRRGKRIFMKESIDQEIKKNNRKELYHGNFTTRLDGSFRPQDRPLHYHEISYQTILIRRPFLGFIVASR
jgi:hypothetical protein